jgi:hypothetical protein
VAGDFAKHFVYERAKIAHAQNKPFIMEETGKGVSQQSTMTCASFSAWNAGMISDVSWSEL